MTSAVAPRLTKAQQATADEADIRRFVAARDHLLDFAQYTFTGYQKAPHLEMVADALEAIERGDLKRLIIEMPPRHGKSELVSIRFPAWALCRKPDRKIISASYGDELAHEMGRRARNCVDTQILFPNVKLSPDSKAKNLWHTMIEQPCPAQCGGQNPTCPVCKNEKELGKIQIQGGQFLAVGIGSGVIGFGGDIITIDDPFKKREEAESETQRQRVWNWYTSEVLTRQEPGAAIVLVMHRWHEDDLVGRVLGADVGRWQTIHLPAIAEDNDQLSRAPGMALWPWRYDESALEERRLEIGERDWNSLYQQRPSPASGAVFKWFPTYSDAPPRFSEIVMPIDTAYTDTAKSDYNAWAAWGRAGGAAYLIDAERFRAEAPDADKQFTARFWRLRQRFPGIPIKVLYRKKIAIDRLTAQHLRMGISTLTEDGKPTRAGLPVVEVKLPSGNTKEEHGILIAADFEAERMLIPAYAVWVDSWLEEHKLFPNGVHDDWVETTILAAHYFFSRPGALPRRPPRQLWGEGA